MRRLYLAGPMRGHNRWGFDNFAEAAKDLRAAGYEVVSPAEHDLELGFDPQSSTLDGFDLRAAFAWDLEQVMAVDALAVLSGWELSKGATAEVAVARAIGTSVYRVNELLHGTIEVVSHR